MQSRPHSEAPASAQYGACSGQLAGLAALELHAYRMRKERNARIIMRSLSHVHSVIPRMRITNGPSPSVRYMKPKSLLSCIYAVLLTVILLTDVEEFHGRAVQSKEINGSDCSARAVNCGMEMSEVKCLNISGFTSNYSLKISSHEYSSRQEITGDSLSY